MVELVKLLSGEVDLAVGAVEPKDVRPGGVQVGGRVGRAELSGTHSFFQVRFLNNL